jgi:hypothetical protein
MNELEKLRNEDRKHIKLWENNYPDEEFYAINRGIRKRLEKLLKKKKKLTGRERFVCAMIYHHGFTRACSDKAMKHLKMARDIGYKKQKWLIASIIDRKLQLQGKKQKYGTQIVEKNGKYKQYKVDKTISDEGRKKLGLPTLKELKRYLEK